MSALIKWEFKKLLLNRGMVISLLAAVVFVIAGCAGISHIQIRSNSLRMERYITQMRPLHEIRM